jgi:hypothetical protein
MYNGQPASKILNHLNNEYYTYYAHSKYALSQTREPHGLLVYLITCTINNIVCCKEVQNV